MCGIAGFSGDFEASVLERMSNAIGFRGPDDSGLCVISNEGIGLAHRRLTIIDLSTSGHQPMWDASRRIVITYNGEIYNYRELKTSLVNSGFSFSSESDTEVLLNLYLRDGVSMLESLNGIFAFAIWDTKERVLFLARDGVGVKPLYYSCTGNGFLFASELKSLLHEHSVDRTIDKEALHSYLTYLWSPAPATMLTSVRKLEPGYALVVRKGEIAKKWRYYDLPYSQGTREISERDAIEATTEQFREAVKRQLVSDVPVGAFLSGGLDSSAIVAMAKEVEPSIDLPCFTIRNDDTVQQKEGFSEDHPFAVSVAESLGLELKTIHVGSEIINRLAEMIFHLDEPQADPAPINALLISELASSNGIKVLLSGTGGDDIFTGYRRHQAVNLERWWSWLPQSYRRILSRTAQHLPKDIPSLRRLSRLFQYAHLERDERLISYFRWMDDGISGYYTSEWQDCLTSCNHKDPLMASLDNLRDDVAPINRMLYIEGKHFLADHNLNYMDKMGMAAGVEVRVPFLDPDLISLAASLPTGYKQKGRQGKWLLKKAMHSYLPANVIYRQKAGFGAPLRQWISSDLKPLIDEMLSESSLQSRGIFDPVKVRDLISKNDAGHIDGAYLIFSMVCIELWCRMFLDTKVPSFSGIQ
jgi:asparagine synthase (glutamine-hydrolysing)